MARIPTLLVLLITAVTAALSLSSPVHADGGKTLRWAETEICVDDQTVAGIWPVAPAVERINLSFAAVTLDYGRACARNEPTIVVLDATYPIESRWTGTVGYDTDGDSRPDSGPAGGSIRGGWVYLNNRYADDWLPEERLTITIHEFIHVLGVSHTDRCDSIMSARVSCARHFRDPTAYDIDVMARLYAPRGYTYRPMWKYAPV